ncbi:nuclear transport factor 2 family protein [Emcibacter sp. SYSU 3D8]|uniref:nuclear transport factor 2 family protein n=1 Tax=Emcibacter sp. SYSU 3D8 TaxID=3133969 RepID=UPI0031FEF5AE
MSDRRAEIVADKHEIETLQRLYAKATDKLGKKSPEVRDEGRKIYHRIFTPDAQVRTANTGNDFVADGPDGWAGVAENALKDYIGTQHLIGTQLTEVNGDQGVLESYLNAWHKNPDNSVYYFLGTYISKVRRYEDGWKIYDMTLRLDTSGIVQTT